MSRFDNPIHLLLAVLAVGLPLLVIGYFALKLALYSRRVKHNAGGQTLIGLTGRAETVISTDGVVFVRGELWHARSEEEIAAGESVRVIGFAQLALIVEQTSL